MAILFNRKACATCEFWGGKREVDPFNSHSRCAAENVQGVCQNKKCSKKNKEVDAGYGSCSKWEKWAVLTKMR